MLKSLTFLHLSQTERLDKYLVSYLKDMAVCGHGKGMALKK